MEKILIIDDDSKIREMLCQVLEREGFEVMDASDGKEGIKLGVYQEYNDRKNNGGQDPDHLFPVALAEIKDALVLLVIYRSIDIDPSQKYQDEVDQYR